MAAPGEHYLDIHQVAEKVGLSTKTIRRRVPRRTFPPPFLFGGAWTWLQTDIDRWMLRVAMENEINPDELADDGKVGDQTVDNRGHSGTSAPGDQKPASQKKARD